MISLQENLSLKPDRNSLFSQTFILLEKIHVERTIRVFSHSFQSLQFSGKRNKPLIGLWALRKNNALELISQSEHALYWQQGENLFALNLLYVCKGYFYYKKLDKERSSLP